MFQFGSVLSKPVQLMHITDGGLGAEPQGAGNFCDFLAKKITSLAAIESNFVLTWSHLKEIIC